MRERNPFWFGLCFLCYLLFETVWVRAPSVEIREICG